MMKANMTLQGTYMHVYMHTYMYVYLFHCVYRDCYGLSPLKTIYKHFVHFHIQFEVDFTFNAIKVKNV